MIPNFSNPILRTKRGAGMHILTIFVKYYKLGVDWSLSLVETQKPFDLRTAKPHQLIKNAKLCSRVTDLSATNFQLSWRPMHPHSIRRRLLSRTQIISLFVICPFTDSSMTMPELLMSLYWLSGMLHNIFWAPRCFGVYVPQLLSLGNLNNTIDHTPSFTYTAATAFSARRGTWIWRVSGLLTHHKLSWRGS